MSTVNKSFTAVGNGDPFDVLAGAQFTFSVSGSFVATVVLEIDPDLRDAWQPAPNVAAITAAASGTVIARGSRSTVRYRFRCSKFTSGTVVTALADDTTQHKDAAGADHLRDALGGVAIYADEVGPIVPPGKTHRSTSAYLTTPLGAPCAIEATFTETAGAGVYTGSVAVPAGAAILDVIVNAVALWNPATSATLKVGDGGNDSGYFAAVNLKSGGDLAAGDSMSLSFAAGKAGAYIANSKVTPRYSASARTISGVITTVGGSGTTGRTRMTVVYHLPVTADIVAAAKV